jgi:hypothetical protein
MKRRNLSTKIRLGIWYNSPKERRQLVVSGSMPRKKVILEKTASNSRQD